MVDDLVQSNKKPNCSNLFYFFTPISNHAGPNYGTLEISFKIYPPQTQCIIAGFNISSLNKIGFYLGISLIFCTNFKPSCTQYSEMNFCHLWKIKLKPQLGNLIQNKPNVNPMFYFWI